PGGRSLLAQYAVCVLWIIRTTQWYCNCHFIRDRNIRSRRLVSDPGTRSSVLGGDSDFQCASVQGGRDTWTIGVRLGDRLPRPQGNGVDRWVGRLAGSELAGNKLRTRAAHSPRRNWATE